MDDLCLTLTEGKARVKGSEGRRESQQGAGEGVSGTNPFTWARYRDTVTTTRRLGSWPASFPERRLGILCHPWISVSK